MDLLAPVGIGNQAAILRPSDLDGGLGSVGDRNPARWDIGRMRHLVAAVGSRPAILEIQEGLAFLGRFTGPLGYTPGYGSPTVRFASEFADVEVDYRLQNLGAVTVLNDHRDGPHFRPRWDMLDSWREEQMAALRWTREHAAPMPDPKPWQYHREVISPGHHDVAVHRYVDVSEKGEPQRLRRFDLVSVPLSNLAAGEGEA